MVCVASRLELKRALTCAARLALNAFEEVLRRRQSKYGKVLEWIKGRIERLRVRESTMCQGMKGVVRQ
jgi:hypothetical protein